ncbi:MAG TPA: hypothetical protein VF885_03175 [Arthrobacter sp.]
MLGFKKFPTARAHRANYFTALTERGLTLPKIGLAAATAAAVLPLVISTVTSEPATVWGWAVSAAIALLIVLLIEGYRLQVLAITDEMERQEADVAGWDM